MSIKIPESLQRIPNPPKALYKTGVAMTDIMGCPRVAIVGARKVTPYGKIVTRMFGAELAQQGIVVVSGLALGVDAIAHTVALEAGGLTVAILPTGLDRIYPSSNRQLAKRIEKQGVLLSEYPPGTRSFPGNFIARNRLVSGLSDVILITEAAEQSGTLHTARFALQQGKKVFAVPGNITSPMSKGTNDLLKAGAELATDTKDILLALGIATNSLKITKPTSKDPQQQKIINILLEGFTDGSTLQQQSGLDIQAFNQALTMLEISGIIQPLGNNQWSFL